MTVLIKRAETLKAAEMTVLSRIGLNQAGRQSLLLARVV